jgi:hypothetical protein
LNVSLPGGGLTASTAISANTWVHFAATRSGTTVRLFRNGALDGTATISGQAGSNSITIGNQAPGLGNNNYLIGYLDDIRLTKGVARYTTSFTPPTAAFPNS